MDQETQRVGKISSGRQDTEITELQSTPACDIYLPGKRQNPPAWLFLDLDVFFSPLWYN